MPLTFNSIANRNTQIESPTEDISKEEVIDWQKYEDMHQAIVKWSNLKKAIDQVPENQRIYYFKKPHFNSYPLLHRAINRCAGSMLQTILNSLPNDEQRISLIKDRIDGEKTALKITFASNLMKKMLKTIMSDKLRSDLQKEYNDYKKPLWLLKEGIFKSIAEMGPHEVKEIIEQIPPTDRFTFLKTSLSQINKLPVLHFLVNRKSRKHGAAKIRIILGSLENDQQRIDVINFKAREINPREEREEMNVLKLAQTCIGETCHEVRALLETIEDTSLREQLAKENEITIANLSVISRITEKSRIKRGLPLKSKSRNKPRKYSLKITPTISPTIVSPTIPNATSQPIVSPILSPAVPAIPEVPTVPTVALLRPTPVMLPAPILQRTSSNSVRRWAEELSLGSPTRTERKDEVPSAWQITDRLDQILNQPLLSNDSCEEDPLETWFSPYLPSKYLTINKDTIEISEPDVSSALTPRLNYVK